jgi:hypothetical protein
LQPELADLRCDYIGQIDPHTGGYRSGQEPRSNFIPPNASITVDFQGANALVSGSKKVDPDSLTSWASDAFIANHHLFIRTASPSIWRPMAARRARPHPAPLCSPYLCARSSEIGTHSPRG